MKTSLLYVCSILLLSVAVNAFDLNTFTSNRNSFVFSPRYRNKIYEEQTALKHRETDPADMWFTQWLDHFDTQEQRTWQQRYYVNNTYWKRGGPVFVMIGGEAALYSSAVNGHYMISNYAQQYNALILGLEHRFYGKSQPLPDLSTPNLKYLTSEQALADLSVFITAMKKKFEAHGASVITFGGSYPGALSAWFRIKYPHITDGSVASSAPVQAALDFFQYLDVVDVSLAGISGQKCDDRIQSATASIQTMLQSDAGKQKLQSLFNLCAPLQTQNDIATFISDLMGNFMGVVQYDNENGPVTIETVCNMMNQGSDDQALSNYIDVSNMFLQQVNATCLDVSYATAINQVKDTQQYPDGVGIRQWTYQTCVEFAYFQTTDSSNQPFGNLVPLSYYTDICRDGFGFSFLPRINGTNIHYGGNKPRGATNIEFVNGSLDPWHALSIRQDFSETVTAIYIDGTAHCADMHLARPTDPVELAEAQQKIATRIGIWLGKSH